MSMIGIICHICLCILFLLYLRRLDANILQSCPLKRLLGKDFNFYIRFRLLLVSYYIYVIRYIVAHWIFITSMFKKFRLLCFDAIDNNGRGQQTEFYLTWMKYYVRQLWQFICQIPTVFLSEIENKIIPRNVKSLNSRKLQRSLFPPV